MTNRRCFVQFPHPGREHDHRSGSDWNRIKNEHRRKFMQFSGRYVDQGGTCQKGVLWAWGEWEPESKLLHEFKNPGSSNGSPYPTYLWEPYYTLDTVESDDYCKLHNTDPFIFGEAFLYSNCKQRNSKGNPTNLQNLEEGSVIVYGSGKNDLNGERQWMLDTVFIVRDFVDYDPCTMQMKSGDSWTPLAFDDDRWKPHTAFIDVVGGPFGCLQKGKMLDSSQSKPMNRLYRGATPDNPIGGMYSFFPAMPAAGDQGQGFARPFIDLENTERFNPRFWQGMKGVTKDLCEDERKYLWEKLVECVYSYELVLGTHACLPKS